MNTGIGFDHSPDRGPTWEHRIGPDSRIRCPDQLVFSPLDDNVVFMSGARRATGLLSPMRHNIEAMSVVGYPGGFTFVHRRYRRQRLPER
jgi:hypothetical protein